MSVLYYNLRQVGGAVSEPLKTVTKRVAPERVMQRVGYGVSRYKPRRAKITSEFPFERVISCNFGRRVGVIRPHICKICCIDVVVYPVSYETGLFVFSVRGLTAKNTVL